MIMTTPSDDRSEIAFFDLETTIPTRPGQGHAILEFGAILVCPKKLIELHNYSTLVKPADVSQITQRSVRCNGITRDAVLSAPSFVQIADTVFDILHGRIWAGHNILRFDCPRIREAFAGINRPAPEPRGTIDSLAVLTQKFGRRAGDMKMATLATYFGLGQQTHRSLDDVRMNLEVLKYCATVLFLESSLPDIFPENSWVSPTAMTRSRGNGNTLVNQTTENASLPSSSIKFVNNLASPPRNNTTEKNHPILSFMSPNTGEVNLPQVQTDPIRLGSFDMAALRHQISMEPLPEDSMEEEEITNPTSEDSSTVNSEPEFVEPDDISIPSIAVTLSPFYRGTQKIKISHRNLPFQVSCRNLKIRFGLSTKFVDHAGRPRLSFVVDVSPSLGKVLEATDGFAQKLSADSGSSSEWRPVLTRKSGFFNPPTVRLHIPTITDGDVSRWGTEIYQKDNMSTEKLVFSRYDVSELDSVFTPGKVVDAYFSLDAYDYMQNAGIRLVAKKLILHTDS